MHTISEFLYSPERFDERGDPEADALRETHALQDAAILDLKFDATLLTLWVLFDCRGTLFMRDGNVAILVAQNVSTFEWFSPPRESRRWRAVAGSIPKIGPQQFSMKLHVGYGPGDRKQRLTFSAATAEFYVGDIPGGDEAPPDFGEDSDERIRAGLAHWDSPFTIIHSSMIRPVDRSEQENAG
ncbi:hypothetical protein [Mycetocola sp. JXN-3]|uniref:hypothetical protein n=1 Tax=Mycetocola sp. JXN-3 TaxID=2116510 RepID=UPI00165D1E06|nr:hypothetical protein [Mycetocola sp. JXN-3]